MTSDVDLVRRAVELLERARLRTWLAGGWAEELHGLSAPRPHAHIDLLYPGRNLDRVDRFLHRAPVAELPPKGDPNRRAFEFEGIPVRILLVQRDAAGWYSDLPSGRHRWLADVFARSGWLRVAGKTALVDYRARGAHSVRAA
jgi:hypothetical protein